MLIVLKRLCSVVNVIMLLLNASLLASQEIEVKIQLEERAFTNFELWLQMGAQYQGQEEHIEYYLNNPKNTFYFLSDKGYMDALGSLRVRCTNKGDSVCYKYRHLDAKTGKTTHRDEHETSIKNGQVMLELLKCLGFTEQLIVKKNRKKYRYGAFEICIDDVEKIGTFVEVELKHNVDDPKVGLKQIYEFLRARNVTQFKEFDRSYMHMLLNPDYNFAEQVSLP